MNPEPPRQPGSQADPAMYHLAHHRAQGKDTSSASRRAHKGHSMHNKEAALPPKMQNHQHPCQPSRIDRAKGTMKTTNPKYTPPSTQGRWEAPSRQANPTSTPQHKAKKPNATAKPSDARPAVPTYRGQSRHAQEVAEAVHKVHTMQMRPHQPSKNKATNPS
ncbi:hypothetical protein CRENBAI_018897 [Crenichthys baileyi]|uniref:Uncharacterized protein n=1 Tax=Crenichthys baileyi TaxID=28760 RepID=A0AAV9QTD0_9TELE